MMRKRVLDPEVQEIAKKRLSMRRSFIRTNNENLESSKLLTPNSDNVQNQKISEVKSRLLTDSSNKYRSSPQYSDVRAVAARPLCQRRPPISNHVSANLYSPLATRFDRTECNSSVKSTSPNSTVLRRQKMLDPEVRAIAAKRLSHRRSMLSNSGSDNFQSQKGPEVQARPLTDSNRKIRSSPQTKPLYSPLMTRFDKTDGNSSLKYFPPILSRRSRNLDPEVRAIAAKRFSQRRSFLANNVSVKMSPSPFKRNAGGSSFRETLIPKAGFDALKQDSPDSSSLRRSLRLLEKESLCAKTLTQDKLQQTSDPLRRNSSTSNRQNCNRELQSAKDSEEQEIKDTLSPLRNFKDISRRGSMLRSAEKRRAVKIPEFSRSSSQLPKPFPKMKNTLLNIAIQNSLKKPKKSTKLKTDDISSANDSIDSMEDFMNLERIVERPSFDFSATCAKMISEANKADSQSKKKRASLVIGKKTPKLLKMKRRESSAITQFSKSPGLNKLSKLQRSTPSFKKNYEMKYTVSKVDAVPDCSPNLKTSSSPIPFINVIAATSEEDTSQGSVVSQDCAVDSPNLKFATDEIVDSNDDNNLSLNTINIPVDLFHKCANLLKEQDEALSQSHDSHLKEILHDKYSKLVCEVHKFGIPAAVKKLSVSERSPTNPTSSLNKSNDEVIGTIDFNSVSPESSDDEDDDAFKSLENSFVSNKSFNSLKGINSNKQWEKLREDNKFLITPSVKKTINITGNNLSPEVPPLDELDDSNTSSSNAALATPRSKNMNSLKNSLKRQLEDLYD